MAASNFNICSQALALIGIGPISSFIGSNVATICGRLYDDRMNELIGSYPWRFSLKKAELQKQSATPVNEYSTIHDLPIDMVDPTIMVVFRSSDVNSTPFKRFEVFGRTIYSNEDRLWVDYPVRQPESIWPPHFYNLAVYTMAWVLAGPITEDDAKVDQWMKVANGGPDQFFRGGYWFTATNLDASQQPPQKFEDFELIAAHLGGGFDGGR